MDNIPYGYCQCGCGQKTKISDHTDRPRGRVKGEPYRYLAQHDKSKNFDPAWRAGYLVMDRGYATPCWVWQRGLSNTGYATVMHKGQRTYVHRTNYTKIHGPLEKGLQLHHLCGVRSCVNPDHLRAIGATEHGSLHSEIGEHNKSAIFTNKQAERIRAQCASGEWTQVELARHHGVHVDTISRLVRYQTYRTSR